MAVQWRSSGTEEADWTVMLTFEGSEAAKEFPDASERSTLVNEMSLKPAPTLTKVKTARGNEPDWVDSKSEVDSKEIS